MNIERLHELFSRDKVSSMAFAGWCWDCGKEIQINIGTTEDIGFIIKGGALYEAAEDDYVGKCDECFKKNKTLENYQTCEVYSRIVGYLRPVSQWNEGKKEEFKDRRYFDINSEEKEEEKATNTDTNSTTSKGA